MATSIKGRRVGLPPRHRSGRLAARLSRSFGLVALLLVGGCPLFVVDHNAFQTGKVLDPRTVRVSTTTFAYAPFRGSFDVGLGRGWEAGVGFGRMIDWGWSGDVSVTRSLYSEEHLFSSALLQAELAKRDDGYPLLGRVTAATAAGFWPTEWLGVFVPIRLSMLLASPVTFRDSGYVWNDSLGEYVYGQRERIFSELKDPVLTAGLGIAAEYKWFSSRFAFTVPLIKPNMSGDDTKLGFDVLPYLGCQIGVRVCLQRSHVRTPGPRAEGSR
jgi:hypothetical protein